MAALKAKLKFPSDLPWNLEHKLCTKGGFRVFSRRPGEWLIVEKPKYGRPKLEVLINGELPEDLQKELRDRCNTVYNQFREPEKFLSVIRTRLNNIAQTMPPQQAAYVREWSKRNCE